MLFTTGSFFLKPFPEKQEISLMPLGHQSFTVLCKSNANEIRGNSFFVLATFLRKVIEFSKDVSKGSKRKNHDLRKFERTKFEVANFPGNQTKHRETKFKAANCCDTNRS